MLTWYIVSNGKVLAEYDGLTRQLHYKYIYAGDQRIAMRDGVNRLHYYLNDHLGSARVVIDSIGTIKDKYHYLAFGSPLDMTTSTGQPNKYTGKPYDMDAGMNLYYFGARYYDGEGRFTQIDPSAARHFSLSGYSYCALNPLRLLDPDGRDYVLAIDNSRAVGFGHVFSIVGRDNHWVIYSYERKNGEGRIGFTDGEMTRVAFTGVVHPV